MHGTSGNTMKGHPTTLAKCIFVYKTCFSVDDPTQSWCCCHLSRDRHLAGGLQPLPLSPLCPSPPSRLPHFHCREGEFFLSSFQAGKGPWHTPSHSLRLRFPHGLGLVFCVSLLSPWEIHLSLISSPGPQISHSYSSDGNFVASSP